MHHKGDKDEEGKGLQGYVSLIAEHQWSLRSYILSLMPGSSDVDDVLQETNVILWEKRKKFKQGTNFIAWASTIARFQVMRSLGIAKRSQELPFSDEFIQSLADRLVPEKKSPLLGAHDQCLVLLEKKQRQLLTVRYTPGQSLKDHAQTLGTTAEVLRVTLHRIRMVLKRCIENTLEKSST